MKSNKKLEQKNLRQKAGSARSTPHSTQKPIPVSSRIIPGTASFSFTRSVRLLITRETYSKIVKSSVHICKELMRIPEDRKKS